jgi:hypothetical protein
MKLLIYMFEKVFSLKINFDKNEVLIIDGDDNMALRYAEIFNCQLNVFPLKYLGVPISASILHVIDYETGGKTSKKA